MSKNSIEYIKHIQDEYKYILSVISDDITETDLIENETLKRAVVRSLEIIGEATKSVSDDFRKKWDSVSWKEMAGMRDRLIHDYMGVNYHIVYDVIKNKIPKLHNQINTILDKEMH